MTIKQKQWQLYYLGCYGGEIAIDGLAGQEAKDATVRWQAEHGLTSDGIEGVNTRGKSQKNPLMRAMTGGVIFDTFPEKNLPANAVDTATVTRRRCSRMCGMLMQSMRTMFTITK